MRVLWGFAALMTMIIIAHYALPSMRLETWALMGATSVGAIVTGVVINRPVRKAPWLLLAAAIGCAAVGQVGHLIGVRATGGADTGPTLVDAVYLLEYPLYVLSLIAFIRSFGSIRDRRSTVDALIMTTGLTLLAWIFLIRPHEVNPAEPMMHRLVGIAYPIGDVAILGLLARLLAPGTARGRALQLLAIGTVGGLMSDVAYGLISQHLPGQDGMPAMRLGWVACYIALGAAALHPSMTGLTSPGAAREPLDTPPLKTSPVRLSALLVTALVPPAYLFIRTFYAENDTIERVVAATCAVLFVLVMSRLWDVNVSYRRSLARERCLRVAGVALATAATVDQIDQTVRGAVQALVGEHPCREALLAVRGEQSLDVVVRTSGEPAPGNDLAALATSWLPQLRKLKSAEPQLVPAGRPGQAEAAPAVRGGFERLLLCPLTLADRPSGDPLIGVLAVLGQERVLGDMSVALGILASQVALAVERVMLSQEIVRRRGERLFRTLVQDALDVILVLDDDGTIKYASPSATRLYGDIPIEGTNASSLTTELERVVIRPVRDPHTGEMGQDPYSGLWRVRRHDGQQLLVQVRYTDLRDDDTVKGRVLTVRDVTEQYQLEDELKHQAFHDTLTGLPNRTLFADRARHALAVARRNRTTAAVLFVDLDDFKVINDTMGHAVGDELLAGVAQRLAAVTRESDTAARLGGDEFALLIENLADPDDVEAFASRVVGAFSEPFELSAGSVLATATVGVATTQDSSDADQLLRHADLALYAAKSDGKRRWHRYEAVLSAGMARRREMQAALEETVAGSAFRLAYQPIVELASGDIRGFEALVRWPHPVLGTVPPADFIDLAEETGLIVPLGSWILRQAITDLARWRGPDPDPRQPLVSVNVSARQFRDPEFIAGLRRYLDETGLVPSALMLELTESSLLRRDDRTGADLAELKHIGVRLAIDDFGTGYSSLSYLRDLPIDVLKIDKSFVDAITESARGREFAELIIGFAATMEIEVIAEGIETSEQRALLTAMGCQYGQGYLLAMPMEWRQAEVLLRSTAARGAR